MKLQDCDVRFLASKEFLNKADERVFDDLTLIFNDRRGYVNFYMRGATNLGRRRKENQDLGAMFNTPFGVGFVLCDGMGGADRGGFAALTATQAFLKYLSHAQASKLKASQTPIIMREAIEVANKTVHDHLRGRGGTTMVAVMIDQFDQAICAHAGDSRIYRVSKEGKIFRTVDHTIRGFLESKERRPCPDAATSLVNFVGIMPSELFISVEVFPAREFQYFLGTTDGVHDCFSVSDQIADPNLTAMDLVNNAVEVSGHDNASAIGLGVNVSMPSFEFPMIIKS